MFQVVQLTCLSTVEIDSQLKMALYLSESVLYVLYHRCQIAILRMIPGPKMPGSET